jgi:hypothetical protein
MTEVLINYIQLCFIVKGVTNMVSVQNVEERGSEGIIPRK